MTVINECSVKGCEEEARDFLAVDNEVTVSLCRRHKLELLNGKKLRMVFQKAPGEWRGFASG